MKKTHLYSNKLTWKERVAIAHKAYRPANFKFALDVRRLRHDMFGPRGRVPLDRSGSSRLEVFNTNGTSLGLQTIFIYKSKSVGDRKTRGGRGHRLFISCPDCAKEIPVGRLHQHYGYKHSPLTAEEQAEFDQIKGSHQGDPTWARYQVLSKKARGW